MLDPRCESKILQGVTTEVTGNCSFSPFPFSPDRMDLHFDHLHRIGEGVPELTRSDLDGYGRAVADHPPALNAAPSRRALHGPRRRAPSGPA